MTQRVQRALISVSDKAGIVELGRALAALGIEILSTGGTAKLLADNGVRGRRGVRSHRLPRDARRSCQDPASDDSRRPAGATRAARAHAGDRGARHRSDRPAGGQSVSRSRRRWRGPAARSRTRSRTSTSAGRRWCARPPRTGAASASLTDAAQYASVIAELAARRRRCRTRRASRWPSPHSIASRTTTPRSATICRRCSPTARAASFPASPTAASSSCRTCATARTRTSSAAFYRDLHPAPGSLVTARQLQGKELSYNNIADADAAWECVKSFDTPACVIVKHANPCGVALGADCARGLQRAPSAPTRRRPSAASSRSTVRSTATRRRSSPSSSSRC